MRKALYIAILIGLVIIPAIEVSGQHFSIRHFNPEKGLNGTYVYATAEDHEGYKWIGTDYGLLRFDGLNFETMDQNDSTRIYFPTALLNTSDDRIIIGYYTGLIKTFNGVHFETLYDGVNNPINDLISFKDEVWALTQNAGIIKISSDSEGGQNLQLSPLKGRKANSLIVYEDRLLIGTNMGLLIFRIGQNKELVFESEVSELINISVEDLEVGLEKSSIWIGTDNGLFALRNASVASGTLQSDVEHLDFLTDKTIVDLKEIKNRDLWLATKYNGLIKVNFNRQNAKPIQFTYLNEKTGFPGNQISTVFLDQDNNAWVGTIGDGLVQVHRKGILFYNFERFRARTVNAISGTSKHEFLFATDVGLIKGSFEGDADSLTFRKINHPTLNNKNVTAIYVDSTDRVFYAVEKEGLFLTDTEFSEITEILFDEAIREIHVRQMVEDNDDQLWVSVVNNGVYVMDLDGNVKDHFSTESGFYHNEIYHIEVDSQGNKWFAAHGAGLAVMRPNGDISYLSKEGVFGPKDINDVAEDENGDIWVGTYGNGVYEYTGEEFIRFSTEEGLLTDYSNAVMSDASNHIWVSHRTGLSRIDEHTKAVSTLQEKDGLNVTEFIFNSIYRDMDHNIWLGNRNGVTFLSDPDEIFQSKILLPIITDVKMDHKDVDLYEYSDEEEVVGRIPKNLELPFDHNNLTFEFIAINLRNPDANLYQYMLEGYEKEWSPTTGDNAATYTNLSPGYYTFKVRQSDNPNHWSDDNVATVSFRIVTPLWATWWAVTIYAVGFIAIIYSFIQFRTESLRKRLNEKKKFLAITEAQNDRFRNFSFITSHNIRSSVVNIKGLIDLLEDHPGNKDFLNMLKISSQKLDVTISSVNELLKMENDKASQDLRPCNVLETVERVITLNGQMIERKGAIVNLDIAEGVNVKAVPAYLESICNNLLTNALRYGTTDNSKEVKISCHPNGNYTTITFQDFGLGIDLKKHGPSMFSLGARFHTSEEGDGLGLFMTKNQLEFIKGKITVDSEVNKGTTVRVALQSAE